MESSLERSTALVFQTSDAGLADRLRQAICVLCAEGKSEHAFRKGSIFDRKLSDRAVFVFHFDRQIVGLQNRLRGRKDFCQAARQEAVIYIIGDPRLKRANGSAVNDASAINERFVEAANFGDVGVRGDDVAIRQNEAQFGIWVSFDVSFEFSDIHEFMGCSGSVGQQSAGRTKQITGTASSAPKQRLAEREPEVFEVAADDGRSK